MHYFGAVNCLRLDSVNEDSHFVEANHLVIGEMGHPYMKSATVGILSSIYLAPLRLREALE